LLLSEYIPWKHGTQILQYEMWGERIGTARPVTVVEDSAKHLATYSHPGHSYISCGVENRREMSLSEQVDLSFKMLDPNVGEFTKRRAGNSHVLTLTPPDLYHSVWLFWDENWRFQFWYANLQAPLRCTSRSVLIHDYVLDIIVQPDMTWSQKDVDEFEELIKRGFFTDEQISSIRAEADRMVETIESVGAPFNEGWENWRPDPNWPVPELPEDWADCR
jgi:hypothetical protein